MKTDNSSNDALEYIKSKHNGEIPYKYGHNECAKLMAEYAEYYNKQHLKAFLKFTQPQLTNEHAQRFVDMYLRSL